MVQSSTCCKTSNFKLCMTWRIETMDMHWEIFSRYRKEPLSSMQYILCIAAVVPVVAGAGCRHSEPEGTVFGKATYQGVPVTEGFVSFDNSQTGFHAVAQLQSDGGYQLGMKNGPKLRTGTYNVT